MEERGIEDREGKKETERRREGKERGRRRREGRRLWYHVSSYLMAVLDSNPLQSFQLVFC